MTTFTIPQHLPQDLLLISEFVDVEAQPQPQSKDTIEDDDDDIASSDSGIESEAEIAKNLTALHEEEEGSEKPLPSESSSDSESESESQSEVEQKDKSRAPLSDGDDDEDNIPTTAAYTQTKNEVFDASITIPDLEEVGVDEELERVGEILSIIDQVAIVKVLPSEYSNRASERALDSETLLVFEDRKVMGYIYETFGPTSQPLYQIKFDQAYPLDPSKIRIGREVFHIPRRSHFVFVGQIKRFKGSDASNVYDEEPGENELEFSDDEAEAAHRSRLKRKRGERAYSISSSRHSTPAPSQMRDQDMMLESVGTMDEHNVNYGPGPSRPTPKPYDDPYSDVNNKPEAATAEIHQYVDEEPPKSASFRHKSFSQSNETRGRGRGRGREKGGKRYPSGSFGHGARRSSLNDADADAEGYDPRRPHESLPSPYLENQTTNPFDYAPNVTRLSWCYPPQGSGQLQNQLSYTFPNASSQASYAQPSTPVQPHINPRFASAFGFRMAVQNSQYPRELQNSTQGISPVSPTRQAQSWTEQWTVPTADPTVPEEKPDS